MPRLNLAAPDDTLDLGPILVVDDDPLTRRLMDIALRSLNFDVVLASDGAEALDLLRTRNIGLVVTDWVMPGMGGRDLCRAIREEITDRYVVIVILTSRGNRGTMVEAMECGANDFLGKPPDLEELQARLSGARRIQQLDRQLAARNAKLEEAYGRIEADLRSADQALRRQLPAPADLGGVRFDWLFEPSAHVGGDIFDVVVTPENDRVVFYHIDVAGHGVPAALTSATLQSLLSGAARRPAGKRDGGAWSNQPILVASEMNRRYCREGEVATYFTMLYGTLELNTGMGEMTIAGHPPPLVWRAGEQRLERLGDGGLPIGMLEEAEFELLHFRLGPGDRLVLHSDGIGECEGPGGEAFGDDRLAACLADSADHSLADFIEQIGVTLSRWRSGPAFDDDVSLLAIEFTDGKGPSRQ